MKLLTTLLASIPLLGLSQESRAWKFDDYSNALAAAYSCEMYLNDRGFGTLPLKFIQDRIIVGNEIFEDIDQWIKAEARRSYTTNETGVGYMCQEALNEKKWEPYSDINTKFREHDKVLQSLHMNLMCFHFHNEILETVRPDVGNTYAADLEAHRSKIDNLFAKPLRVYKPYERDHSLWASKRAFSALFDPESTQLSYFGLQSSDDIQKNADSLIAACSEKVLGRQQKQASRNSTSRYSEYKISLSLICDSAEEALKLFVSNEFGQFGGVDDFGGVGDWKGQEVAYRATEVDIELNNEQIDKSEVLLSVKNKRGEQSYLFVNFSTGLLHSWDAENEVWVKENYEMCSSTGIAEHKKTGKKVMLLENWIYE